MIELVYLNVNFGPALEAASCEMDVDRVTPV